MKISVSLVLVFPSFSSFYSFLFFFFLFPCFPLLSLDTTVLFIFLSPNSSERSPSASFPYFSKTLVYTLHVIYSHITGPCHPVFTPQSFTYTNSGSVEGSMEMRLTLYSPCRVSGSAIPLYFGYTRLRQG